jgi:hypothetical protein
MLTFFAKLITIKEAKMVEMPKKMQLWSVEKLKPYERNSRSHSDEQIERIAQSMKVFGFTNPILIDGASGIIAGHGRLAAAKKLGLEKVPVIQLDHFSEEQKRAYIIADNRLAELSTWNTEILNSELADLQDLGFDLALTGFEKIQFDDVKPLDDMPDLASGDRAPIQQMTFTVHDSQAETIKEALEIAKSMGAFIGTENENSNGNALARVAELFLNERK